MQPLWREGENLAAIFGHANRMLELRREFFIARDGRPTIGEHFYIWFAQINHWLDGEKHAFAQDFAFARFAKV